MRRIHLKFASLSAALALLLGACGVGDIFGFAEPETRPCPQVFKIGDASRLIKYQSGKGRDLLDVEFEAGIGNLDWRCKYDDDMLIVELAVEIIVKKGPASRADQVDMPIFVSIIDRGQKVLAKQVFNSQIEFEKGRRRTGSLEEFEQQIPLRSGQTGDDYAIVVGFQLTREQLGEVREDR